MNFSSDLHTHTIVSGHAFNTLFENIDYCVENGIKILGTSDHGPTMPGAPHIWYFGNLRVLPRTIKGITVLKGCEANILDIDGTVDIPFHEASYLDYMIASFHEPVFEPNTIENNTKAMINAIAKNDKIEIVGHLGNPNYDIDFEQVVKKAKEKDIMIEINNTSIRGTSRAGSDHNCSLIAKLCKKYSTKIILTSDAHICFAIGQFDEAIAMLKSIDFPEELIMNEPDKLIAHFKNKGKLQDL